MHAARKSAAQGIGSDLLARIGEGARTVRCEGTRPIVVRGEILKDVFFVAAGRVESRYKLWRGSPQVLVLGQGELFGERAVLEDEASDAAVRPIEDGVVLAAVPVDQIKALLEGDPALKRAFEDCVAARRALLKAMALAKESTQAYG